ncbi:hypothetical protein EIP86_007907 [Pleurotus ostreatoroseus]|nr:hypothetical protein EIP86_007907 [Pleurotus ostreatoroseus]
MPPARVPQMAAPSSGSGRSRNDTHHAQPQSRIPTPRPQSKRKSNERSNVHDQLLQSRPPKAKFSKNVALNALFTITKNRSAKKAKPTKSLLNSKFAASQLSLASKFDALSQVTTKATSSKRVSPYPHPQELVQLDPSDPRFKMPTLPFKVTKHTARAQPVQVKPMLIPVNRKLSARGYEDAELEASFASNMSLNSPADMPVPVKQEDSREYTREYTPMDISPAPFRVQQETSTRHKSTRPLGISRTASQRSFGRDVSNLEKLYTGEAKTSGAGKKLARSALPAEWLSASKETTPRAESVSDYFDHDSHEDTRENLSVEAMLFPSSDEMDVDESESSFSSATASPPSPPCPLTRDTPQLAPFPASTVAPTSSTETDDSKLLLKKDIPLAGLFRNLSPARRGERRSLHEDSSIGSVMQSFDDSPQQPLHKKRRSFSPDSSLRHRQLLLEDDSLNSSPGLMSSPSVSKLERLQAKPLKALTIEPMVNANNKRPRRLALSALIPPTEVVIDNALKSARPIMQSGTEEKEKEDAKVRRFAAPPVRRAFSAAYPSNMNLADQTQDSVNTSNSIDSDAPDASPALAYAKRQQVKTIRRCDGTDDFRSVTGATAMLKRDNDMRRGRKSDEGVVAERNTPRSKYLSAGAGLGSFGDNEAHGKILPCHRVKEDGLMRITASTVNKLLDGDFDRKIDAFHVIDCRFDYEYNGGHIPGAVNINTTAGVEDFFLGQQVQKPRPSTSGDPNKKTVIVFHCEFSLQRAPTFAKHLRSKDRALNNQFYPSVHYPEVYVLEGGYCEYFKHSATRCEPRSYVRMDDPHFASHRSQDLDQFRKGKFGRTKSYAYGEGKNNLLTALQPKRSSAPGVATGLFAAGNMARARRTNGMLQTLQEDTSGATDDDDDDIGDSPCPPPSKAAGFQMLGKKLPRAPLSRAETYGPSRLALGH